MTLTKNFFTGVFAIAAFGVAAPATYAEEFSPAASATVSTSYLWRGFDLGSGTPAASGDVSVSAGGAYAGVWVSSGDAAAGTEFDIFAGYGGEIEGITYDINITSYVYPTGQYEKTEGQVGDFMEAIISVGYGPVSISYYDNIAGNKGGYSPSEDYHYTSVSADFGSWSFLVGDHDFGGGSSDDATHLDVTYSYNDNLSFTLSSWLDFTGDEPSPTFVASYSIAIE